MLLGNGPSARKELFYFSDDGALISMRYNDWKLVFMEQRTRGTMAVWSDPFVALRLPTLFNLRQDPYERADITSNMYWEWMLNRAYMLYGAQMLVTRFLETFKAYPPRQKAASFTVDQALDALQRPTRNWVQSSLREQEWRPVPRAGLVFFCP